MIPTPQFGVNKVIHRVTSLKQTPPLPLGEGWGEGKFLFSNFP